VAVRILPQPVRTGKNTVALADRERHASTHFPTHPRDFLPRGWFFPALTAGVFSSGDGMTGIVFSRSGSTHPLGKLDDEFRIDCHSAVRNILRGMAADAAMPESEFIRHILYAHAFGGVDEYKSAMSARLDAMFGSARPSPVGKAD